MNRLLPQNHEQFVSLAINFIANHIDVIASQFDPILGSVNVVNVSDVSKTMLCCFLGFYYASSHLTFCNWLIYSILMYGFEI